MTAKEWLSRARKMSGRLRALQTSKEQAFARATSVVVGGGEQVSGGEPADKNAAYAVFYREITKKLREFGYIDEDGNVLKPYTMPTVETVLSWKE